MGLFGESLISVLREFFASINKAFVLAGGWGVGWGGGGHWAIILWGLDTFSCFATRETPGIYRVHK